MRIINNKKKKRIAEKSKVIVNAWKGIVKQILFLQIWD